jgi:hypothetical protein
MLCKVGGRKSFRSKVAALSMMVGVFAAVSAHGAATPSDGGWEKVDSDDGIEVFRREVANSPVIALRGAGVVNAPITRVASVILDDERAVEWVDSLSESKLVKMFGPREFLEYTHIGTPIILKDRDFLTRGSVEADPKDKSLLVKMWSVEDPLVPPGKYIRGELNGKWKLTSVESGTKTLVEAEMHADPKGDVPKWMVNLFQKSWPHKTIESLRKQVSKSDIKIISQVEEFFVAPPAAKK